MNIKDRITQLRTLAELLEDCQERIGSLEIAALELPFNGVELQILCHEAAALSVVRGLTSSYSLQRLVNDGNCWNISLRTLEDPINKDK